MMIRPMWALVGSEPPTTTRASTPEISDVDETINEQITELEFLRSAICPWTASGRSDYDCLRDI